MINKTRSVVLGCMFLMVMLFAVFSCERPSSPDFELQHSIDIPLVKNLNYKLLGEGSSVIIDTTKADFENLFSVDGDGLIYLSTEFDFEVGSFDNIIPDFDVDSTEVDTKIGRIEIDDFSSTFESEIGKFKNEPESVDDQENKIGVFEIDYEGRGSTSFERVTGIPADSVTIGNPVPGTEPDDPAIVIIELQEDDFVRAEIEGGRMIFNFTNNLGLDLEKVTARLLSSYDEEQNNGIPTGTPMVFHNVVHGLTSSGAVFLSPGEELMATLALEVVIEWQTQILAARPGRLEVGARNQNLEVRNATATTMPQKLTPDTEELVLSDPDFDYAIVSDQPAEDERYELIMTIINKTEIPMSDSTQTGMPAILITNSDGDIIDGPQRFENISSPGTTRLGKDETGQVIVNLAGQKLTRRLSYELNIGTPGGRSVTVDQNDLVLVFSTITELQFVEARSAVDPQDGIVLEDVKDVKGDFIRAEVDDGRLLLTFENRSVLPLRLDYIRFFNETAFTAKNTGRFFAAGSEIGELRDLELPPMSSVTDSIPLSGTGISNRIAYEGTASSPGSSEQATVFSSDLIVTHMDGSVLLGSATAVLKSQEFSETESTDISKDDFLLVSPDHFVQASSGLLRIHNIINEIDLDISSLTLSFPNIRYDRDGSGTYDPGDTLWFELKDQNRIRRASDTSRPQPEIRQKLDNLRVYAPGNEVKYHITAVTEDTRNAEDGDSVRTVQSTDRFTALITVEDFSLSKAYGQVQTRTEFLNEDYHDDGFIDVFDDNEAEISKIDDLEGISERLSGIHLVNPGFDLIYQTNLGVPGTIIAAIVGINEKGEEVYLSGIPGSSMEVRSGDDYGNLGARGSQIDRSDLIRFDFLPANRMGELSEKKVIRFDRETSNVDEFLSSFPVEIRFIGKVMVNPDLVEGFVLDPIDFNASFGIDIPMNLSTETGNPASIEDTISVDLSNLPSPEDDIAIDELTLYLFYENGLPFQTGLRFQFLDENYQVITNSANEPLEDVAFSVGAAKINNTSRFVSQPNIGMTEIRLDGNQLDNLHLTRNILLKGTMATSRDDLSGEVKLRARDYIGISVNASVKTSVRVN